MHWSGQSHWTFHRASPVDPAANVRLCVLGYKPIIDKHGGYRKLDSYTLACVAQLATLRFCKTFLNRRNDPCGRQFDRMTQAARSGRENMIEGSERSGRSKGSEITLTDVGRASFGELKGDFEFWLLQLRKPNRRPPSAWTAGGRCASAWPEPARMPANPSGAEPATPTAAEPGR